MSTAGCASWTGFTLLISCSNVSSVEDERYTQVLEGGEWKLWYAQAAKALNQLQSLSRTVIDTKKPKKLAQLYDALSRNQAYLVNP